MNQKAKVLLLITALAVPGVLSQCSVSCYGESCDYWGGVSAEYNCVTMEEVWDCDCTACTCDDDGTVFASDDGNGSCASTCSGTTCDYWSNTCEYLEIVHGCDCSGCECGDSSYSGGGYDGSGYGDDASCDVDRDDWLGDGYCDDTVSTAGAEYNSIACGWDLGDCCASTCVDSGGNNACGSNG